jgi:adenylate cyclase
MTPDTDTLIQRLRRRKLVQWALAYLAGAWVLLQLITLLGTTYGWPAGVMRSAPVLLAVGFVAALVLAWYHGEKGRQRVSGPELLMLGALLLIAGTAVAWVGRGGERPAATAVLPGAAEPAVDARSLAVLPFLDLSEAGDQKWFADGLAEEILTSLARLPELRVVGRNSSFLVADGAAEDWQIAERLGVAHLVKGSVRQFGERLRVTAQLVRTTDGVQLWSEAYDRDAADLLDVQRDVAEKVASALDVLLDDERRTRMFGARTRSVEAFAAYLRGREILFAAHRDDDRTLAEANLWLGRALELDPRFARAALLFSDRYAHRVLDGPDHEGAAAADMSDAEALQRLRSALDQAARNAPDAYHRIIAEINREFFAPSWRRLPSLFEQLRGAVAVGHPSSDDLWAPQALLIAGEFDLARQWAGRALEAEPLEGVSHWIVALVETAAGDHAHARSLLTDGVGLIGEDPLLIWLDFTLSTIAGDRPGALQRIISTSDTWRTLGLAIRGERDAALASLEAQERNAWPQWKLLRVYHELGDEERTRDLARRVDALPTGPAILAIQMLEAGRTLTFDPADTPNFAARLREVGVDPSSLPVLPRLSAAGGAP